MIINPYIFGELEGYGYLYNWFTINGNENNLITDLHAPSNTEWNTLSTYLGGDSVSGGKLKEIGIIRWDTPNTGATDEVNFKGIPGGLRNGIGIFTNIGTIAQFFSITEFDGSNAYAIRLRYDNDDTSIFSFTKRAGSSIKCMRVLTAQEQIDFVDGEIVETKTDYDNNSYNVIRIGTQGWTITNLKTTHYLDSTALTKVTNTAAWGVLITEGYCAYDNDESNV